jgi:hypothetical protein
VSQQEMQRLIAQAALQNHDWRRADRAACASCGCG